MASSGGMAQEPGRLPVQAGPGGSPAALREQVLGLAEELAGATRRLRRLADGKARLSRLLDQVLEGIDAGVVLRRGGRVTAANRAARALGAVSGRDGELTCHRALDVPSGATVRPRGEGGPVWLVRRRQVPLEEEAGELIVVHDVTRLVELEQQARRKGRLELLGRMAAEVAHEVRNPLGSLELLASLLVDDLADRPESRELAVQIQLGVRQLSSTVTRLLATARGARLRRRRVDAAALVREIGAFVGPLAESRGVELAIEAGGAPLFAEIDPDAAQQALLNLLGNALDASPAGGRVTIGVAREGKTVRFTVADDGPGVPEGMRERIFEPFFSTREEGTGLGLALVERVALAHGGRVTVGAAPRGGALFRLELPVVSDRIEAADRPQGAEGAEG